MSEEEIIKRLKELKEEGAILGEDEVKTLLKLIEKQDKIIDLMAEYIEYESNVYYKDKNEVIDIFRKKCE